ncbi:MAG: glycoside hydrolase family 2 [Dehalococcoidia bacterium]|nr:glycoside hydrolase family 2 [Dehalococcoidia bacterium]
MTAFALRAVAPYNPRMERTSLRPQLERDGWLSLDGAWQFAFDDAGCWRQPGDVTWTREIVVPYAPETPASGIGDPSFHLVCWYRRRFDAPERAPGERVILHFGAVDYAATVGVNGHAVARHEGGYTPFSADITHVLASGQQTLVVRAVDDPHDLAAPRGKQDWQLEPHQIWYPRTSGIWQTVWIEKLPAAAIAGLRWTPSVERWEIGLDAAVDGDADGLRLRVELHARGQLLADDVYAVLEGELTRRIALFDPGIGDGRNELLWTPSHPTLIDARLQLLDASGAVVDDVRSYTALRSVSADAGAFLLNGRPYTLRMVLDQGYWPQSGLTAPSDEALVRDVGLAKAMGFNGVRKHQKIEDPRYLYWADRLGLLVWEEMPSAYRFTRRSIGRLTREWADAVERDCSHPCIVAWVPFNESWGVPDLPTAAAQRHYIAAMYELTKTLDPTRPVIGNDGWEHTVTDILTIHDYESDLSIIERRYASPEGLPGLRPHGRRVALEGYAQDGRPVMLSEFGGIACAADAERTWGYVRADSADDLGDRYERLLQTVHASPVFSGFCYTQFADTYQETNGLLFADRTPKFPLERMRAATRGRRH